MTDHKTVREALAQMLNEAQYKTWVKKETFSRATSALATLDRIMQGQGWKDISTRPTDEEKSFLVFIPKQPGDEYDIVLQVSNFNGDMYPDHMQCAVDYMDRVLDATRWMPLPEPPK